jgi:hypothetical protein
LRAASENAAASDVAVPKRIAGARSAFAPSSRVRTATWSRSCSATVLANAASSPVRAPEPDAAA